MDADWNELSCVPLPPSSVPGVPNQITTLAFDTSQELLWAGNGTGRVTSFYGNGLAKYTSLIAHPALDGPVHQFLFNDKGIIALGPRGIHMAMRRGPPLWHLSHEDMKDLRCMSFTSKATSEILVAGLQNFMFIIDLNKGEIVKQIPTADHYTIMKKSRFICAAAKDGHVHLIDPVKFTVTQKWRAHSAYINDMDVQQDFVVTCGASVKQQPTTSYMLDPYVNVFDLKNMSVMSPIPFPPLAAYVRMHPRMITTGIVVSQSGQMHVVDLLNPNTSNVRQANVSSYVSRIEIASSGEAIVLADVQGNMHLWGSPSKCQFVELAQPTEWPSEGPPPPQMDWSTETPLNTIGMPYYRETLLSAWPSNLVSDVGAPPPKYDVKNLNWTGYGYHGPNTRGGYRNQADNTRSADKGLNSIQAPKFLSERARELAKAPGSGSVPNASMDEVAEALGSTELESLKPDASRMYQNVEIKYSKFGVDDFDFGFYNKTRGRYVGLENHIANSYANSLLQVLHFTPLIRNLALQHAATDCLSEQCLLCELGFLSDMLQKAEVSTCQATNMLKCLSNHPQAVQLGLLEHDHRHTLPVKMQHLTTFLLRTMADDFRAKSPNPSTMDQVLATSALTTMQCNTCKTETNKRESTCVVDLMYPSQIKGPRSRRVTFSQVLKASVECETPARGYCVFCTRYQTLKTRKIIDAVPSVLTLNASASKVMMSADSKMLWATPGWLPEEIGIIVDNGSFYCYQGEDLKLHLQRGVHNIHVYSLIGLSINIDSGPLQKGHHVAMINVAHAEPTPPGESQWHLFNDFSVKPVSTAEALTFNTGWKMPSVLVYQLKSANNKIDTDWAKNLDTSVLYKDTMSHPGEKTYEILRAEDERPGRESIFALDTEFVAVKEPEIEVNSDGERVTIRPRIYGLARVSVVRGQGIDEQKPCIDDYINIKEPITDYLTQFSGITHGDLDPRTSKHNLVSLKMAYKRLWVLLNLGCKFLGHGLKTDFRVINIQVPKAQTIDTIDLFFLESRLRKLSLAFLASCLLKEDIQLETHDSIEDARTALKLYRKYLEFDDAGILGMRLSEVYQTGKNQNWRPQREGQLAQQTGNPVMEVEGPSTPARGLSGQAPSTPFAARGGFTGSPLR